MSKNTNLSFLTDYITADITNGRIGINNASPTVAFDVVGATKITGVLTLTGALTGTSGTFSGLVSGGNSSPSTSYNAGSWFTGDGLVAGNISSVGGIQINSSTTSTLSAIRFGDGDGANNLYDQGFIIYRHTTDAMLFGTNRSTVMTLTSAGNVGIGTSSPQTALDVIKSGTYQIHVANSSSSYADGRIHFGGLGTGDPYYYGTIGWDQSDVTMRIGAQCGNATGGIAFYTSPGTAAQSERMRITSAGKVGIGFTAPGGKLDVQDTGLAAPVDGQPGTGLNIRRTDGVLGLAIGYDDNGSSYLQVNRMDGNLTSVYHLMLQPVRGNVFIGTTTGAYKLTVNGQPGANGYTLWTNYSDRRLKENIQPLVNTSILDKINSLNPVTFNYNVASGYDKETRARKVSGFIAQELQEIFPEMVGTLKLNDEEYLDTNLSNLSLYLVKAVQELSTEINLLKQK